MTDKKKKEKKPLGKREIIRRIILIVSIVVFLCAGGYLAKYFLDSHKSESDFGSLKTEEGHDLKALYKQNPDIVGWIKIDGTKIDYPVMQTVSDPEYYLRRNFKKEHSTAGTPFVDAMSSMKTAPVSANWVIYGHNMKNGTMFHDEIKYEDYDFYKEHKIIQFETIEGIGNSGEYEVVAAFYTQIFKEDGDQFKYYAYPSITDAYTYNQYVAGCKSLSIYDTGITPQYGQQLITLSTCAYHVDDGRFVVVAVKK